MLVSIDNVSIAGIAAAVPPKVVKIEEYTEVFGEKKIKRIKKSTGVEEVRVVDNGIITSDLCCEAAQKLLKELNLEPDDIDGIVFSSFSPDYKAPATSIIMQHRLGLRKDVVAMDISFGCSGYVYGLYQACMLVSAGGCRRVLLCAGDTQSLMVNPKDRSMKMLIGDAGSATIIEKGKKSFKFNMGCDGSGYQSIIIEAGGYRMPCDASTGIEVEDVDGNIRSKEDLHMNGMEVMKFALSAVPPTIEQVLNLADIGKDEVDLFAMHQPNKMILESLCMEMDIDPKVMPVGLGKTGNTSSASIPLLLATLKDQGYDFQNASKVVMCGFGVGLSIGAIVLDLESTKVLSVLNYGG